VGTSIPPTPEPLEGYTFEGFRNADGTVATRNLLGISTTVQCVAGAVRVAERRIRAELLPRYPNVDDVVALNHAYGCGVAINAPGAEIPIRTIANLARHPNFGGETLVVSLGCEKLQPERLELGDCGLVRLQDAEHRSFEEMLNAVLRLAEARLERLNRRQRVSCPAADLMVGVQCGGSDAFSGITANPAVGFAADLLVRAGATVLFSEVTEVRDAAHLLAARAATPEVGAALARELGWYDAYLARGGADRSANPTPGNKRGGLSNVVEKALGSVAKSGTTALRAVAGPGERVSAKGLVFLATPASDFICGTLQLAAGMNVHVFTTGEGTPYGLAMAPVIKLSTRTALGLRWADLIDIDAGAASIEQTGWRLFHQILAAASGQRTAAERLGLQNDLVLFNPAPVT
jgi:galactarate dehydratase